MLGGWVAWSAAARITLYEITGSARLEVDRAAYAVQAPVLGRVVETRLAVAREVAAGDVLVQLDASAEKLQLIQKRAELTSLGPELEALRTQVTALERARADERQASRVAADEARASARGAQAPARYTTEEEKRLTELRAAGLIAERDYQRGRAEAEQARANFDREQIAVHRLEQEQRTRESDRDAQLRRLFADITHLEGQIATVTAGIQVLQNEIERRAIRAPVAGVLAEAATLRAGAVLHEGDRIAAIVPHGRIHVVAQFPPPAALGRIAPGQRAQLRLDGFPWAQYGTVPATVTRVASEVRDGTVRVELAVDTTHPTRIPLQHGLPGSVEIAVERIAPGALALRNAGRMLTRTEPQ